jgi:hypothetical protein
MKHLLAKAALMVVVLGLGWLAGLSLVWLAIVGIIAYLILSRI